MHNGLGQQIVENAVVAALGSGVVDLEHGFGFSTADRLMLDRGRGQDARAPGGVICVQHAGKMHAAPGSGTFARDHTVAHDGEGKCCGIAAGNLPGLERVGRFGQGSERGRHWYVLLLSFLFWASMFMRA